MREPRAAGGRDRRAGSILVVGDYDSDGATGVAVAMRGLARLGAARRGYAVPHRFRHGYGLSPALVDEIAARTPDLIVTVDHGIASHAGIGARAELGIPVLVTDHHLPGRPAGRAAIVNPNQPRDGSRARPSAGVGVMFYLLLATPASLRATDWFTGRGASPSCRAARPRRARHRCRHGPARSQQPRARRAGLKRIRAASPGGVQRCWMSAAASSGR
jgi:single-stranded-DNA-specific exonuclease